MSQLLPPYRINTDGQLGCASLAAGYAPRSAYKEDETKISTILLLLGCGIYFYANEGHEPAHVHGRKGEVGGNLAMVRGLIRRHHGL
jgi:hypothetical protein